MVNVEGSLSADLIAQQNFGPARRGFDPEEVRAFLVKVAAEIVALHERQSALEDARRDAEYRAAHPSFDEETLLGAVGEETAHILKSAHEAAGDIRTRAEENASRILKEAHQKAEAMRGQAETVLARRTEEAEAVAGRIRESAKAEAERLVDQAREQSKAVRAQAEAERNAMIEGAQATREKILSALSKKRNVAVAQVEQLRAGRERLLESYEVVRRTLEEATSDLARAEVEARSAADAVRHRPLSLDDPDGLEEDSEPTNPTMPIIQKRLRPASSDPGAPPPPARPAPLTGTPPPVRAATVATSRPVPTAAPAPPAAAAADTAGSVGAAPSAPASAVNTSTLASTAQAVSTGLGQAGPVPPGSAPDSSAPSGEHPAPPTTGAGTQSEPAPSTPVDGDAAEPRERSAAAVFGLAPTESLPGSEARAPSSFRSASASLTVVPGDSPGASAPGPGDADPTDAGPTDRSSSTIVQADEGPPGEAASHTAISGVADDEVASGTGSDTVEVAEAAVNGAPAGPPSVAAASDTVESLFARIRADREKAVAYAHEVLEDRPVPDEDEALLQRRDTAVEPIESNLTRRLKRALQDDQNDLLDRLRSLRPSQKAADVVLPARETHIARFRNAGKPFLREALASGAAYTASIIPGVKTSEQGAGLDQAADDLAEAVVEPLRRRLQDVLSAGDGDDPVVLAEAVGGAYREWKTKRVEVVASDLVAAAFAAGAYAATPGGTQLRWLVLDVDGPCPDCDDNALAGGQPKGEPYPTGQRHPPAHPGCRCLLIPHLG